MPTIPADGSPVRYVLDHARFDAFAAPAVGAALEGLSTEGCCIIVDLAKVDFIDSTGLATLVQAMKHYRQSGRDLVLCSIGEPIKIIFELTRLDRAFDIYADADEAQAAMVS